MTRIHVTLVLPRCLDILYFFFFNDTATTEIYTLSLHDALPICDLLRGEDGRPGGRDRPPAAVQPSSGAGRSEEHTSELQSQSNLVCRLLLEKKKKQIQLPLSSSDLTVATRPYPVRCRRVQRDST